MVWAIMFLVFVFAAPAMFGLIGSQTGLTGASGFLAHLSPFVIGFMLVVRLIWVVQTKGLIG